MSDEKTWTDAEIKDLLARFVEHMRDLNYHFSETPLERRQRNFLSDILWLSKEAECVLKGQVFKNPNDEE